MVWGEVGVRCILGEKTILEKTAYGVTVSPATIFCNCICLAILLFSEAIQSDLV